MADSKQSEETDYADAISKKKVLTGKPQYTHQILL